MKKFFISLTLQGSPVKVNTMAGSLTLAMEKVKKLYPIARNLRMIGSETVTEY